MTPIQFIVSELSNCVERIVPQKQIKYLADKNDIDKSLLPLYHRIFVCDKYLGLRKASQKKVIMASSKFTSVDLSAANKQKLELLSTLLTTGNFGINSDSEDFIPPSTNTYFIGPNSYNVDFSNEFWGIRHFHLKGEKEDDTLLYYATNNDKIYFLYIGTHSDLYTETIVKIIINEFPELLTVLGFASLPDMPLPAIGQVPNQSPEHIRKLWVSGSNVAFIINNKYYTATNPQTLSRLNSRLIYIGSNILYQIEHQIKEFTNYLATKYAVQSFNFIVNQEISQTSINNGEIYITESTTNEGAKLSIDYLKCIGIINSILNLS